MIKHFSREVQDKLYHKYIKNDLFCHWSPLLIQMKIERNELDVTTLWYQAKKVLKTLQKEEKDRRCVLIPFIYLELLEDFKNIRLDNGTTITRTAILAEQSAVTVMCVVLTELLNVVQPGHKIEEYDNFPICVAIINIIRNHPHTQFLMDKFFKKEKDDTGKDIIITPYDPLTLDYDTEVEEELVTDEVEIMIEVLHKLTKGLEEPFGKKYEEWIGFCREVCMFQEFLDLLKKEEPKGNDWGINQKMVCNMIGIFNHEKELMHSLRTLNNAISEKHLRTYLNNYTDFNGSASALTMKQYNVLKHILRKDG